MKNKNDVCEVRMIQFFDDHFYKVTLEDESHRYIPSVTTKLGIVAKPFLAKWRGDIGNREADMRMRESADRGVRIHNGYEVLNTGGQVIYNPRLSPIYSQDEIQEMSLQTECNIAVIEYQDEMYDLVKLQAWLDIVKPKVISAEKTVYDLEFNDAGTTDAIYQIEEGEYSINGRTPLKLEGGLYVVDLKTGNVVGDEANMQTACYAKCVEKMGLGEVKGTLILHTGAKTKTGIAGLATIFRNQEEIKEDYESYRLAAQLWERKNKDYQPKVFEFPTVLTYRPDAI